MAAKILVLIFVKVQANESRVQIRRKFKIHLDGARGLPPKVTLLYFFVLWRILKKLKLYYEGKILRTEKCLRNEFYVIFWGFFSFWVKW